MHAAEPFIEKIIFYQLTSQQKERVKDLIALLRDVCSTPVLFAEKEAQLHSFLTARSLTVFSQGKYPVVADYLFSHGYPFAINYHEFCRNMYSLPLLKKSLLLGEVVLAYLPAKYVRLFTAVFELFGYHVTEAESIPALTKALRTGANYVVFDQDMPGHRQKISETRHRVLDLLKQHRKTHPLFALSVIKDFDQGSLFNDIGSGTKDVVNLMLSPDEYAQFLINYLSDFLMGKTFEALGEPGKSGGPLPMARKGARINFSLGLRDAKSIYQAFIEDDYHVHQRLRDTALDEMASLQLKTGMVRWITDYLPERHAERAEKPHEISAQQEKITIKLPPEKDQSAASKHGEQIH